uniref:Uncharacterized protein n=1 Tax=Strigamia maritima TaxID=126957 RepID=T1JM79_STRMM
MYRVFSGAKNIPNPKVGHVRSLRHSLSLSPVNVAMSSGGRLALFAEKAALAVLTTYPFVNAFSFLMLVAEQARVTSESFLSILSSLIIYVHVVLMFMCALALKLDDANHRVALAHSAQLVLLVYYNVSSGLGPHYADGLLIRVLSHAIGTVASYLTLAAKLGRSTGLHRAATVLFGVFAAGCAYAVQCDTDFVLALRLAYHAFTLDLDLVPAVVFHMLAVVGFLVCALTFLNETITRHVAAVLALLVLFINVAVDWRLDFWTRRQRADFWCAFRIAADNVPILAALTLFALQPMPSVDETGNKKSNDARTCH